MNIKKFNKEGHLFFGTINWIQHPETLKAEKEGTEVRAKGGPHRCEQQDRQNDGCKVDGTPEEEAGTSSVQRP